MFFYFRDWSIFLYLFVKSGKFWNMFYCSFLIYIHAYTLLYSIKSWNFQKIIFEMSNPSLAEQTILTKEKIWSKKFYYSVLCQWTWISGYLLIKLTNHMFSNQMLLLLIKIKYIAKYGKMITVVIFQSEFHDDAIIR